MKPERWHQIQNLCHETLGREPGERATFLDAACAGDVELQREVESLLKYAACTDDPLDQPTGEGVRRLVGKMMATTLLPGTHIGPYRVETCLGTGGMAKVYRALDTRLDRAVALKFLNGLFFDHGFERLVREARAAARLDHPSICSIYEVMEGEGRCCIVMQYVEGETLASRIARKPIDVGDALEFAIQISDAIGEAHAKGIVHRDIKPQNIMITPRGQAMVLDFGLAKSVTAIDPSKCEPEKQKHSTEEGLVIGTVAYMSPEQASGRELDGRADLFSLAVVLFEMSTGVLPIQGATVALTFNAILNLPVTPPRQIKPNLPVELERIILKGLEKHADLRYQSASEFLADLIRLKRDLQLGQSATTATVARHRGRDLSYALAGLLVAAVLGAFGLFRSGTPPIDVERRQYIQLTNFTDSTTNPAVSADGRRLTFIRGPSTFLDPGQLYVKSLPDGEPLRLTDDNRLKMAPTFSPDGSQIAYTIMTDGGRWATWIVSVLGGEPRPMLANAAALTWIGDRRILFSEIKHDVHMAVVMGTDSRSEVRDLYVPPTKTGMAHRSHLSPNGKWALIASEMNTSGWLPCRVVSSEGSSAGRVVGPPRAKCTYAAWSPDGQWMYFSADAGGGFHTWRQRFPDGTPEQITFGTTEEEGIAMFPDGRSFASAVGITVSAIWVHDRGNERQITFEGYAQLPSFSTDGAKLYYLQRGSGVRQWVTGELWVLDLSTGSRKRFFSDISMAQYNVSVDGTRVVFVRTDPGKEGVWIASIDGRFPPACVTMEPATRAFFGPAGTVILQAEEGQAEYLFRIGEDGSSRQKVTLEPIIDIISVSPDRRWAVVWARGSGDGPSRPMVAYPLDGGDPVRLCENCANSNGPARGQTPPVLAWSLDGRYLYLSFGAWDGETTYETGKTFVLPLVRPSTLPPAFKGDMDVASMPDVQVIPHGGIFPGPRPSLYAYTRTTSYRNIHRIPIP